MEEIQPGRQYVLRVWFEDGQSWEDMESLLPTVSTAMPSATAPYYDETSLIPVTDMDTGLTENSEAVFVASAPVLVISHPEAGDAQLLASLTPVTRHD